MGQAQTAEPTIVSSKPVTIVSSKPLTPEPEPSRGALGTAGDIVQSTGQYVMGAAKEAGGQIAGMADLIMGLVTHPIDTAQQVVGTTLERQGDEAAKAIAAYRDEDYVGAVQHGSAYLVPILGPAVSDVIEEGRQTGDWAGATGRLTTMASPFLVGKVAKAAQAAPRGPELPVPTTASERMRMSGSRTGRPVSWVEGITERTLPAAGQFERLRAAQQARLQGLADETIARVSTLRGSPEEVGLAVQRELAAAKKEMKRGASELYQQVDDLGSGVTVPMAEVKAAATDLRRRIAQQEQFMPPADLAAVTRRLDAILDSPDAAPFAVLRDVRSDLRDISRSLQEPMPGRSAFVTNRLTSAIDRALTGAAESVPGLNALLKRADREYATIAKTFEDTLIDKLVTGASEKIPAYVRGASLEEIRTLARTIPEAEMNQVRASIMRSMLDDATSGELGRPGGALERVGISAEGLPPVRPRTLRGDSLQKAMEKLGEDKLTTLFGHDAAQELLQLADLAQRVKPVSAGQAGGLIAGGINAGLISALTPGFATLAQGAVTAGSLNALARILTRQPRARSLTRSYLQALSRGETQVALAYGLMVSKMMDDAHQDAPQAPPPGQGPGPVGRVNAPAGAGPGGL